MRDNGVKRVACLLVYNRYWNLERWLTAWNFSYHYGVKFYVIHNEGTPRVNKKIDSVVTKFPVERIRHTNAGLDIGTFRDAIKGEIFPEKDWQQLFWFVDDALPLSKTFLLPYIDILEVPYVGLACAEISQEHKEHVRTNALGIKRCVADNIVFPDGPLNKEACYQFEHRAIGTTLSEQVATLGYRYMQVATKPDEYIWDIGLRLHLNHWDRFFTEFPDCKRLGTRN